LAERPNEIVSKEDLIARVWPDTFVDEGIRVPRGRAVTGRVKFDILQSGSRLGGDRMQFNQLKRREFIALIGGAPVCERSNRALANAS
jgi:hypothetical protein